MRKTILSLAVIATVITGCENKTTPQEFKRISIILEPKSNSKVSGTVVFLEKNGVVTFEAKMIGLTPGVHAVHIHEKSDCTAADGSSVGGDWNPTSKKHGKWGVGEYQKGDIGNFTADDKGIGVFPPFATSEWCIGCGDPTKDIVGKALVVHQNADDFVSQPDGKSGAIIACSAITIKK